MHNENQPMSILSPYESFHFIAPDFELSAERANWPPYTLDARKEASVSEFDSIFSNKEHTRHL